MYIASRAAPTPPMSRCRRSAAVALCGALLALGLAACGGSDDERLLPGENAAEIISNLEQVEELATNGQCASAEDAIEQIDAQVQALPATVSDELRQNLSTGLDRLREVTLDSCGIAGEGDEGAGGGAGAGGNDADRSDGDGAGRDNGDGDGGGAPGGGGTGGAGAT